MQIELIEQDTKVRGEGVVVIADAGLAGGAEAPPVVSDHPVTGRQQGSSLLLPRVPAEGIAVDEHDGNTRPVVFVVDPDGTGIFPADGDERHRDLSLTGIPGMAWRWRWRPRMSGARCGAGPVTGQTARSDCALQVGRAVSAT